MKEEVADRFYDEHDEPEEPRSCRTCMHRAMIENDTETGAFHRKILTRSLGLIPVTGEDKHHNLEAYKDALKAIEGLTKIDVCMVFPPMAVDIGHVCEGWRPA